MKELDTTASGSGQPNAEDRPKGGASAQTPPAVVASDGRLTPLEHGQRELVPGTNRTFVTAGRSKSTLVDSTLARSPEYRAAETLHGWSSHEQHTAEPLLLTRDAFLAAIVAAHEPCARGQYTPHTPALAPHLRAKGGK